MAHEHLHLKDEFGTEQTREKQFRVSMALLGTLAGGVLLINSWGGRAFYAPDSFNTELFAMLGAILLGAPIVVHAIASLIRRESHMDELAAKVQAVISNHEDGRELVEQFGLQYFYFPITEQNKRKQLLVTRGFRG